MSVKSASSQGEQPSVVRAGYLKKLKTSKKKYFVLRGETCESSARLEYYDSEKKFNSGQAPKRSIPLKTCFNINKRHDTKHKHVIALYTKDDCFCVVLDNEEDLELWLKSLLSQQRGEEVADGETPRPTFEHVWQVTLLNRGLGATPMISGYNKTTDSSIYRLCLTDKTLSLIRKDCDTPQVELSLSSIRTCGSLKNFFYLEVGRSSGIGAGELWMETEDSNIANNIHQTVFHAMSSNSSSSREELGPKIRNRSSSATESSKPNNMTRRQTLACGTTKPIPYQQDHTPNVSEIPAPPCTSTNNTTGFTDSRARCDSMPSASRPRTTSEGNHPIPVWDRVGTYLLPHRPQSLHARDISHSPPSGSPVSPPSAACSTDSAGSSLSIDESEPWHDVDIHRGRFPTSLTPDEAIAEENCDDCTDNPCIIHSSPTPSCYVAMAPISSDDGYVDMSPRGRHTTMSPAASMSSVTSGTPSTDMRFAEYPLEKVSSYFTPSEDDETSSAERPRTYSMGSKPYKSRIDQARDRAWSVGSKSKKGYNRVLPPHGPHAHPGAKSSSAPMLSNSRLHSSHNSIDPMDDLMEMDFSKKVPAGYIDIKATKVPSGYVDMRPGHVERSQDTTPYVDMRPGSSPAKPIHLQNEVTRPDYMEMDNKRTNSRTFSSMSPMTSMSPLSNYPQHNSDYTDMNYQNKTSQNFDMYLASPAKSTLSGYSHGSPSSMDYIDMDYTMARPDTDGYVEMSLQSKSSDYTNMSIGGKKKERKPKKETTRSQPITIQNTQPSQKLSGTSPIYAILPGRKNSTGTPPKMYLPLQNSPYSSLPRQQRSRKNSRRDSKDSSSSSIATPSSSSTIFPFSLNSPSSPIYTSGKSPEARNRIQENDYTLMDFEKKPPALPTAPTHINQTHSDYVNYNPAPKKITSTDSGDYAIMKPGVLDARVPLNISGLELGESCFKPIDDLKVSRPGSENSEVGSTTSTLVGSRPASVNSDNKPMEGQLHYASLDLATIGDEEPSRSPRTVKNQTIDATNVTVDASFTYAEIDFVRSEGLKSNQLLTNAKIKH